MEHIKESFRKFLSIWHPGSEYQVRNALVYLENKVGESLKFDEFTPKVDLLQWHDLCKMTYHDIPFLY